MRRAQLWEKLQPGYVEGWGFGRHKHDLRSVCEVVESLAGSGLDLRRWHLHCSLGAAKPCRTLGKDGSSASVLIVSMPRSHERLITSQEAARQLGVSIGALYKLIDRRVLLATKVGRHVMLSSSEVEQLRRSGSPEE